VATETNTFHMSFGEQTITLDDVPKLVVISVMGCLVNTPQRITDVFELVVSLLGVSTREATDELGLVWGNSVRLEWLRSKFFDVTDANLDRRIECTIRAFLLYLVGCTLFSDKSGARVSIYYLTLFVSFYAWGATALAYLYKQLGYVSRDGVKQIVGYLPLLEVY